MGYAHRQLHRTLKTMISKKVLTPKQKVILAGLNVVDAITNNISIIATAGITVIALVLHQKVLNARVVETCPTSLNAVVIHQTVLGDAYACISRVALYGPPAPLQD